MRFIVAGKSIAKLLHADGMAEKSIYAIQLDDVTSGANTEPKLSTINVRTAVDSTVKGLANTMRAVLGFQGDLISDFAKADGAVRKLIDNNRSKKFGLLAQSAWTAGHIVPIFWFLNIKQIKS